MRWHYPDPRARRVFAFHKPETLAERAGARDKGRLAAQEQAGKQFTPEQRWWLDRIAEHMGVNLTIGEDDLSGGEFFAHGGLFRARREFGPDLVLLLDELSAALVG